VHAVVVVRQGAAADGEELTEHCRTELAGYKVPKAIHLADSIPRTLVGKFDKRALQRLYAEQPAPAVLCQGGSAA
jgi:acyl-CoA synthetase (AMP-forming)/AMP-acid ligase II